LGVSYYTIFSSYGYEAPPDPPSFPTRRSSDLRHCCCCLWRWAGQFRKFRKYYRTYWLWLIGIRQHIHKFWNHSRQRMVGSWQQRSEEHTSELQSRENLVCRLLLEKKNRRQT